MTIRVYSSTDLPAIINLFHDTVHEVNSRDYSPEQLDAWAPAVADKKIWSSRLSSSFTYVAEEHWSIIGFGNLTRDGWVDMLYTHKNHQRGGVATAILRRLTEEASLLQFRVLRVTSSITAKPFFESQGFRFDWEQEKAHKGYVFKSVVMIKDMKG